MPYKILVVEDEPLVRMLAVEVVEAAGFEAIEAANADDAIKLLEAITDIRIVFTDIDMPGSMDGLRLAAAVSDRWPPIHIIVVSGAKRPEAGDLPDRGVFFSKPYDVGLVTRTMHRMLEA
ncbi:response regulator [Rhizobium sp.]|uniref:response regulator n=1 Tax=Rhizobium sp. TaxID=391 RepID=UPI0028B16711